MDDNEETVECRWCHELYDTGELKIEKGLGPVCETCIAAIKSHGERMCLEDFSDEAYEEWKQQHKEH